MTNIVFNYMYTLFEVIVLREIARLVVSLAPSRLKVFVVRKVNFSLLRVAHISAMLL